MRLQGLDEALDALSRPWPAVSRRRRPLVSRCRHAPFANRHAPGGYMAGPHGGSKAGLDARRRAERSPSGVPVWRRGQDGRRRLRSVLFVTQQLIVAGRAVIFVRKKFPRHGQFDAIAFGIGQPRNLEIEVDRRHDAVAELLFDQRLPSGAVDHYQLVKAIDQRVGRRHRSAAHGNLVEEPFLAFIEVEELRGLFALRFGELHLTEKRADDQNLRHAADLADDMFPAPAFVALNIENFLSQIAAFHNSLPSGEEVHATNLPDKAQGGVEANVKAPRAVRSAAIYRRRRPEVARANRPPRWDLAGRPMRLP